MQERSEEKKKAGDNEAKNKKTASQNQPKPRRGRGTQTDRKSRHKKTGRTLGGGTQGLRKQKKKKRRKDAKTNIKIAVGSTEWREPWGPGSTGEALE